MRGAGARRDSLSAARSRRQTARVCVLLTGVAVAAALVGYVGGSGRWPWQQPVQAAIDGVGGGGAQPDRFLKSWFGVSKVAGGTPGWHRQGVPKWSWGDENPAEEQPKVVSRHNAAERDKPPPDRMIVVARGKEDVSYLSIFLPDIPHTVYQGGWRPEHSLLDRGIEPAFKAAPQAKETNVYLQYIVDHYDRLPNTIAFIHAHRVSWHLGDVVDLLRDLRWGEIAYANLRYRNYSHWACGPQSTFPCEWSGSVLTPRNPTDPRYAHQPDFGSVQQISAMVAQHWPAYFEAELGPLPEFIYAPCCAEFVVSAERVRGRPKAFYQKALDLANSMDADSDHVDVALAFEYAWHMIFGEPAIHWPLYKCQLLRCSEGDGAADGPQDGTVLGTGISISSEGGGDSGDTAPHDTSSGTGDTKVGNDASDGKGTADEGNGSGSAQTGSTGGSGSGASAGYTSETRDGGGQADASSDQIAEGRSAGSTSGGSKGAVAEDATASTAQAGSDSAVVKGGSNAASTA